MICSAPPPVAKRDPGSRTGHVGASSRNLRQALSGRRLQPGRTSLDHRRRLRHGSWSGGEVTVWDPDTARQVQVFFRPNQLICAVGFSPDGLGLASGGSPGPNGAGEVRLWSVSDWRDQGSVGNHDHGVWGLVFTPDGERLITAGINPTVRVWNIASRREVMSSRDTKDPSLELR